MRPPLDCVRRYIRPPAAVRRRTLREASLRLDFQFAQRLQGPPGDFGVLVPLALHPVAQLRDQSEIDIHRLKVYHTLANAPIAVSRGKLTGSLPSSRRASSTAARQPEAVDST